MTMHFTKEYYNETQYQGDTITGKMAPITVGTAQRDILRVRSCIVCMSISYTFCFLKLTYNDVDTLL